jgi:hypothetical protein
MLDWCTTAGEHLHAVCVCGWEAPDVFAVYRSEGKG